ncbi:UNVERIFIED_ORG: hypothetical protein ABID33_000531 [Xanthobacter viscosus]|uniref:Uncharacterized protein n=1 Tax=Xanthobacter autotrophicus TaxID=280 RepID=A0A6C1KVZ6_XANAU|nr:hypothetical protein [Xanthobacter autotrophicus]TLX43603.1 hypothetical protein FBQ73_05660 [Xanthobacter autotrophicus]
MRLLVVFVLLLLVLTGLFVPALFAFGWILLAVLGVALLVALFRGALVVGVGLPIALGASAFDFVRGRRGAPPLPRHPQPGDPDYLNWANREGSYAPGAKPKRPFLDELPPAPQARRGIY